MRALMFIAALLATLFPVITLAQEEDEDYIDQGVEEILDQVDVSDWDSWFLDSPQQMRQLWDDRLPSDYIGDVVRGQADIADWGNITDSISEVIKSILPSALLLFMSYMGFAVIGSVLGAAQLSDGIGNSAQLILSALIGSFVLSQVWTLIADCQTSIRGIGELMDVVQPILIAVLVLFGSVQSAAVMQPMSVVLSGTIINILVDIVLPLAVIGGVIGVIDILMGNERIGGVGKLCNRMCKWAVGLCSILYLLVTSIRGVTASTVDGVLIRTGKFAASSLPFVGRLVSDSLDTALGCMNMVKNGIGVMGMLLGFIWVLRPMLLLMLNILVLRSAAALSSPICSDGYPKVLSAIADMLSAMLSALLASTVMFIVTVGLLAGIGGIT